MDLWKENMLIAFCIGLNMLVILDVYRACCLISSLVVHESFYCAGCVVFCLVALKPFHLPKETATQNTKLMEDKQSSAHLNAKPVHTLTKQKAEREAERVGQKNEMVQMLLRQLEVRKQQETARKKAAMEAGWPIQDTDTFEGYGLAEDIQPFIEQVRLVKRFRNANRDVVKSKSDLELSGNVLDVEGAKEEVNAARESAEDWDIVEAEIAES